MPDPICIMKSKMYCRNFNVQTFQGMTTWNVYESYIERIGVFFHFDSNTIAGTCEGKSKRNISSDS